MNLNNANSICCIVLITSYLFIKYFLSALSSAYGQQTRFCLPLCDSYPLNYLFLKDGLQIGSRSFFCINVEKTEFPSFLLLS